MRLSAFLLIAALAAVAMPAGATTMVELSEAELTYVADLIAEAEVETVDAERDDSAIWIRTVTTLRLTHVLKGRAIEGDRVRVRELGGSLRGEDTEVASAPVYTAGERVLVFLEWEERGDDAMMRTLGMSQGKFTLVEEPDTGRDVMLKRAPRTGERFDEAAVPLPAVRRYADDVEQTIAQAVSEHHVPPYSRIPGLPLWKDQRFYADAKAAGQDIDPRWDDVRVRILVGTQFEGTPPDEVPTTPMGGER